MVGNVYVQNSCEIFSIYSSKENVMKVADGIEKNVIDTQKEMDSVAAITD